MIICKIWSQCTCKLWMIFTYCKTNNISYWYLYLLTEGEIVIIMDKASTKALLYWPHYGKVNSAMPKCLIFINKKWSMLKFNISHKAKWMQAEAKTLYPFKCIYILSFIFFSICTSQVHQGELFQKRLIVVLQNWLQLYIKNQTIPMRLLQNSVRKIY